MSSSSSVKPGLCHTDSDDRMCWLSGRDCGGVFTSGMTMLTGGGTGPGSDCPTQKKLVGMPLGTCTFTSTTGGTICSPNVESCTTGSTNGGVVDHTGSIASDRGCVIQTTKFVLVIPTKPFVDILPMIVQRRRS